MSARGLGGSLALACVLLAGSAHAQAVRSFDDPGASPQSPPSTQPRYPTTPTPPRAPEQAGYPATPSAVTPQATPPSPPAYPQNYAGQGAAGAGQQQSGPGYVLAPPVLPYRDGMDPPQGYVLEKRRNGGLMLGGGLTLAGAYGVGLVYALTKSFDNGTGWLAVPIVGPWGAIKGRSFECESDNNVSREDVDKCVDGALNEVTSITFLAMTGLVQAVGATLFFVGVGDITREWVRADLASVEVEANVGPVSDGYGLTLSGRF